MIAPSATTGARHGFACALAIAACVAIVYWPGVHGFWGRDDFMQLAFARLLGTPWPLFVHDHFPVPGSVFRPLGFASMWLCERLLGTGYAPNAIADLVLHAGVGLALFALLRRAAIPHLLALLCALLFAVHPAVIGAALWWSARFDLLASLFVLLALQAGFAYRERRGTGALAAALLAAFAAMLCKEIGLVAIAALTALWLRWARAEPAHRGLALRAVALAWLCALIWLGWRGLVLGTPSSGLVGATPLGSAIAAGLWQWSRQACGYLTFWTRLDATPRVALASACILAVAAMLAVLARRPSRLPWRRQGDLAICGLCLLALPALLQAPVAALNAAPLRIDVSSIETAMQSRLYYLGIAGAVMLLAAVLTPFWNVSGAKLRIALVFPLALAAAAFAWVSRDSARTFAARSVEISGVARAAVAAVGQLDLPSSQCHVVFLGVEPAPEWSIYVSMDSVIKALSPDIDRLAHCWFDADYVTFFHLQAAPATPADAAPYRAREVGGKRLPWRAIGNLVIAYLDPPQDVAVHELARMRFLRYRDGRFDDVSAQVAAGRIAVRLQ